MDKTKIALIYDFDRTLSPKDMQEFSYFKKIGIEDAAEFWNEVRETSEANKMDTILTYMMLMLKKSKLLHKDDLINCGKDIELFKGVNTWFSRINEYANTKNLDVEHYIISSGLQEMIEGTSIKDEFKKIYACSFVYNEKQEAIWPARVVNYTTKTQYLFRINKGILDECNDVDLNKSTPDSDKHIPYSQMIYIGDGFTDVPCMKVLSQFNGYTIAVYQDEHSKEKLAQPLFDAKRAMFISYADYSQDSEMEILVRSIIDTIAANIKLSYLTGN